jgi:thiol-disulfide isomerase/thioredoxin
MRGRVASGAADVLAGLAAVFLFVIIDSFVHIAADLRQGVVALALLSAIAGLVRGAARPENLWLKALLVASAGTLVLLLLGWNQLMHPVLALLLLATVSFTVLGVRSRRLCARHSAAKSAITLLAPLGALLVVAVVAIPSFASRVATRQVTVTPPRFSFTANDGSIQSGAGLRGRVVVLDFWATWCPACRREMPEMEKLYRRYEADPRVSIWAVDALGDNETPEKARGFIAKNGYTLPIGFMREQLIAAFGVDGLPSLVVMDKSGSIRLLHLGYDRSEGLQPELTREIETLLRETMK